MTTVKNTVIPITYVSIKKIDSVVLLVFIISLTRVYLRV